ncbi:MAG: hypothetical protein GY839_09965 [candidate division Zixibacteria bacterium]|nr:hypothetical protein [candidate division Zixibacteria bacterium]
MDKMKKEKIRGYIQRGFCTGQIWRDSRISIEYYNIDLVAEFPEVIFFRKWEYHTTYPAVIAREVLVVVTEQGYKTSYFSHSYEGHHMSLVESEIFTSEQKAIAYAQKLVRAYS